MTAGFSPERIRRLLFSLHQIRHVFRLLGGYARRKESAQDAKKKAASFLAAESRLSLYPYIPEAPWMG